MAANLQRRSRLDEISFPQLARQFIHESDAWTCLTLHRPKHSHHNSLHRHPITRQGTQEAFGTMAEFSWHPGLNLQNNIYLSGDAVWSSWELLRCPGGSGFKLTERANVWNASSLQLQPHQKLLNVPTHIY